LGEGRVLTSEGYIITEESVQAMEGGGRGYNPGASSVAEGVRVAVRNRADATYEAVTEDPVGTLASLSNPWSLAVGVFSAAFGGTTALLEASDETNEGRRNELYGEAIVSGAEVGAGILGAKAMEPGRPGAGSGPKGKGGVDGSRGSGLKALREGDVPFDREKLARIQRNLERGGKDGKNKVKFSYDDARLAKMEAKGAYLPGEGGKPGEIVLSSTPSRSAVIEELYHLGQHRRTGWSPHFAKTKGLYKAVELDAQRKLLTFDPKKSNVVWTATEAQNLAEALKFWTTW
jgi:hypothetical protein